MIALSDAPLFTREYDSLQDFRPETGATYLYGVTAEPRSEFALKLMRRVRGVRFVEIRETDFGTFETDVKDYERMVIRRRSRVIEFISSLGSGAIYLDITGLGHATWAPLVRVCLETGRPFRVIYLEPETYSATPVPSVGEIFDLSERIEGIAPIPLFTSLEDRPEDEICFVPLLGFEGVRLSHMLNEVQPLARKVFPIIGLPGFQPHYPTDAYLGNAASLEKYKAYRNIRFAKSNCPFSLFYALSEIASRYPGDQIKVGLIGTKPHALGGILFAISRLSNVEIVYDHVKRKVGRTVGTARCLVYGISDFLPPARQGAF